MNKVQARKNMHSLIKHVFLKDFNSFFKKDLDLIWIISKDLDLNLNPFSSF